jgi:hypothetical protein
MFDLEIEDYADPYRDFEDTYVPVQECASRMGLTVEAVERLVRMRLLKARHHGILMVQPACLPGHTT